MRLIYSRPILDDLSQGSRIAFARQIRFMSQDEVSDKLGLTGECKRRTMTRYERENRHPKEKRTKEIADILNVSYESIKKYDYKDPIDIIYTLFWIEELVPNYKVTIDDVKNINNKDSIIIQKAINEWNIMKSKREQRQISYKEYIEWKLTYSLEEIPND